MYTLIYSRDLLHRGGLWILRTNAKTLLRQLGETLYKCGDIACHISGGYFAYRWRLYIEY